MLTFLGYLAAIAASYAIVRYLVIPAIRKSRAPSVGGNPSKLPNDNNPLP